jgi:hypothetical protein
MKFSPVTLVSVLCITLATVEPVNSNPSPPTFPLITSLTNWDFRNISSWSGGGGPILNISDDSSHPFAGRSFGGATRDRLRGTRAFGSGYPYGNISSTTISGRPFPFGVWPLWWGQNFMGSDEYGPQLDTVRPGGLLVVQPVTSTDPTWNNITSEETYHIVADRDTNLAIMTSIVTWCHATPLWATIFDPETSPIKPENVIQYYRASSFALAFKGYNNTFARQVNTEAPITDSTPLPDFVEYSPFRNCVDGVIMDALPIVDSQPADDGGLGTTLGIVFGIFGIPILCFFWCICRFCQSCIRGR